MRQSKICYTLSDDIIPSKNEPYIADIQDISSKPTPLYSSYSPPTIEQDPIYPAPLFAELAYYDPAGTVGAL